MKWFSRKLVAVLLALQFAAPVQAFDLGGWGAFGSSSRSSSVPQSFFNGIPSESGATFTGGPVATKDYLDVLQAGALNVSSITGGRWATTVADGAVLGPELVPALAFNTWTLINGAATTATTFSTTSVGGAYKVVFTTGRKYVVTISGESSVAFELKSLRSGSGLNVFGTAFGTYEFTADSTEIYFRLSDAGTFSVDNISVREVIPTWLPTDTEGAELYPSTLVRGVRKFVDADPLEFPRLNVQPARTNKVTCRKANPVDTTNITKAGDAAAVLSLANELPATLANAIDENGNPVDLTEACTSGKVYKLDNSAGATNAFANVGGLVGNTNKHSYSIYGRVGAGTGIVYIGGAGGVNITSDGYSKLGQNGQTPNSTTAFLTIRANPGAVIYFILPQLEEGSFATPPIYKDSTGADPLTSITRQATVCSLPTSGRLRANDFAIEGVVIPSAGGQNTNSSILASQPDSSNWLDVFADPTAINIRKRLAGVTVASPYTAYTYSSNVPFHYQAYQSSVYGMGIRVRQFTEGAWGAWSAWATNPDTQDAPIASTMQIGSRNGVSQFAGNYPMFRVWFSSDPKAFLESRPLSAADDGVFYAKADEDRDAA